MIKISLLTFLGFLTMLFGSPFISLPWRWKEYILVVLGFIIIISSLLLRKELHKVLKIINNTDEIKSDTYVENNPQ